MSLKPHELKQYHVFLASPGDVNAERQHVRQFFEQYNRHTARLWNTRFEVVDWENYSTIGVGRPQELITLQTLEKYSDSLALVIGIMGQRFGSPSGEAESGTEEEFNWAMDSHTQHGYPEIKWFFRKFEKLEMPSALEQAEQALNQWKSVLAFRKRMQDFNDPVFYTEYANTQTFREMLENDLSQWLSDDARPWVSERPVGTKSVATSMAPPIKYYSSLERDFRRLDIAGIDNDRSFEIPLSEVYVRLRVMFDEDAPEETKEYEAGAIDIQTALLRYPKLVIVGDPGSGKSTFLKYIALMLARSLLASDSSIAFEKLCLPEPLPIPIFLSCWDLADFLKRHKQVRLDALIEFITERLNACDFPTSPIGVEELLASGNCCLLFDGLDEVPTDAGRSAVSRLLEDCVERYGKNRFVVTSRVRAYTGDTILKGNFTRCDIQPFDVNDRAEFVRNWVALLFRISPEDVEAASDDASHEFNSLTQGIEDSDRIRPLAVNPLLLTVIAIVHWNRKRLPEQRVDLYDECIDVLLGQRKEAERIQIGRKVGALDENLEQHTHEERAWVRKRFAEIALHILSQNGKQDEATKTEIVKLLTPRFLDQGAANEEQAGFRAERFLDRQELQSGLLVSRRAQSYRFVHLTFQEYLSAWQLSNMEFADVTRIMGPRLRQAKWFEALQLLGAQWAKESDERVDRYVSWLLDNLEGSITDQAPVVALTANIVKDIIGIAEITPTTRTRFEEAVAATLDAFRPKSGVPAQTQLEILDALALLGAAVKPHLISATSANPFEVRRRAIEILLPHLSEDELFTLKHILEDRSKEPIKTYLIAITECNAERASELLFNRFKPTNEKLSAAVLETRLHTIIDRKVARKIIYLIANENSGGDTYNPQYKNVALTNLVKEWPDEKTRVLVNECAMKDENYDIRTNSLELLANTWPDLETRNLLSKCADRDALGDFRKNMLKILVKTWPDEKTRAFISDCSLRDTSDQVRIFALECLIKQWPDGRTRALLQKRLNNLDISKHRRLEALVSLGEMHSYFGKLIFTRDCDGLAPYRDPARQLSVKHVYQAAKKAKLPEDKINCTIRSLSTHMGWDITKGLT